MEPMDGDDHFTIGELARRTGLSVRTIRFYSDAGVVPPSGRSPAGYRLYDTEALARLETREPFGTSDWTWRPSPACLTGS